MGLVERAGALGGNHLWCLHGRDLSEAGRALVEPLIVQRWAGYSVRFPSFERRLDTPYAAVSSERLAQYVAQVFVGRPRSQLFLGRSVEHVLAKSVVLDGGEELRARS